MTDIWLVIHIPKTAGTSFRWALEKQFGKSQVIWDYGVASDTTSEIVRKHIYQETQSSGPRELIEEMSKVGAKVLMDHLVVLFLIIYASRVSKTSNVGIGRALPHIR